MKEALAAREQAQRHLDETKQALEQAKKEAYEKAKKLATEQVASMGLDAEKYYQSLEADLAAKSNPPKDAAAVAKAARGIMSWQSIT